MTVTEEKGEEMSSPMQKTEQGKEWGEEKGEEINHQQRADQEEETYKVFKEQDERWQDVVQDARQHISHREAHAEYRNEFTRTIRQYQVLEDLVKLIHCSPISSEIVSGQTGGAETAHNQYTASRLRCLNQDLLRIIAEFAFDRGHGAIVRMIDRNVYQSYRQHLHYRHQLKLQRNDVSSVQPFFIYIRKRPLLAYELARQNYNVVDVSTYSLDNNAVFNGRERDTLTESSEPYSNLVQVHDGKLARNGRILEMKHKVFAVSQSFSEHATNEEVCAAVVEPLAVQVLRGQPATILFYGQTGTGKTHTLLGSVEYIGRRFAGLCVELTFYEIRGKKCFDLLSDRNIVHLRSDEEEKVHVRGCKALQFDTLSPDEFSRVMRVALANRSSKVTERNPVSSRSHAICTLTLLKSDSRNSKKTSLRLVDLAGSERNYETSNFTAADHRESADINYALMALKNCFRAYNAMCFHDNEALQSSKSQPRERAPYRASLLTRILRECFIRETRHTTSVIATISPSPTDLEHTLNTLEHVTMMDPALDNIPIQRSVSVDVMIDGCAQPNKPVDSWSHRELMAWLSHADGGKFSQLVLPPSMTGKGLIELNVASLTELCAGQLREAREEEEGAAWVEEGATTKGQVIIAKRLYALLRREQNASLLRQSKAHQTL